MNTLAYKPIVTVIDVLEAGACLGGVKEFVLKHETIAVKAEDFPHEEWVQVAAVGDGYGNGNGYGNGDGNGDGYGDGYGDGNGDGYGNGDGNGDGYGDGYGNGYGED